MSKQEIAEKLNVSQIVENMNCKWVIYDSIGWNNQKSLIFRVDTWPRI